MAMARSGHPGRRRSLGLVLATCLLGYPLLTAGTPGAPPVAPPPASSEAPLDVPYAVWTTDALTRVGPTDTPRDRPDIAIAAARGEYESFQIVVSGGTSAVSEIDLTVADLVGPGGAVIPSSQVTLYREHYVEIGRNSPHDETGANLPLPPGTYPDALIPFVDPDTGEALDGSLRAAGAGVAPQRNQPYWVDVLVPRTAVAGDYRGTYTVTSDLGSHQASITLTVYDFDLPARPALQSTFLNWSGAESVNRELLRHRLMPGGSRPGPENDPRLASVNARNVAFYSGADQETCTMSPPPSADALTARAAQLGQPGVLLYNYTADEIDDCVGLEERLRDWATALHEAGVAQLVTMTPRRALFSDGAGGHEVDIWVVLPKMYDAAPATTVAAMDLGMQVWSYNTLVQDDYSPKWLIDFDPANFRVQPGFLNQSLGLTGLLYWRADNWVTDDPWTDVYTFEGEYPGEGLLVYPGEAVGMAGGAAPSMRLKWLRDGVDDYDYIAMARAAGGTDEVAEIVGSVGTGWDSWSADHTRLTDARSGLAEMIEAAG